MDKRQRCYWKMVAIYDRLMTSGVPSKAKLLWMRWDMWSRVNAVRS